MEGLNINLLVGRYYLLNKILIHNKCNNSLKSEINTTINNKHNLLNEVGSEIKALGRFRLDAER